MRSGTGGSRKGRTLFLGLIGTLVLAGAAFAAIAWERELDPVAVEPSSFDEARISRGGQLAALGNCSVCHTSAGGEPYAGGYAIETPFGTIYSTNITPDVRTGIGDWSEAAFIRAMREGVDREGHHLYPAFPYHFFARTTDEELRALYAYVMTRPPVEAEARENDLPFPLGFRPLLAGWKLLFHRDRPDDDDLRERAAADAGAYYVDGLAHCGACHTPVNFLGAPRQSQRLSGGETDGWIAPALNEESRSPVPWAEESLLTYLTSGRHVFHAAAAGPMRPVIRSLGGAAEDDVRAIAVHVASLSPEPPAAPEPALARSYSPRRAALVAEATGSAPMGTEPGAADGALLWSGLCSSCHYPADPSVKNWPWLETATALHLDRPDNLLRVILAGLGDASEAPDRFMPGYAALPDVQIAALVSHLRTEVAGLEPWNDVEERLDEIRRERGEAGNER